MATPQSVDVSGPFAGILRRPFLTCVFAGVLVMAVRLALVPLIPIPVPSVHDEFSYLLGADTFASGRVTNPPHPMWVHFETFHVNQTPTYCSKYPPAQALVLAFGQKFMGHPWFGVWLSVGVMFASICWMLQGWVSPGYALLTTVMAILEWGIATYWMNSYWGPAVAVTGGALVIGAVPRLAGRITMTLVLTATVGMVLLANSRPYEGILTVMACAGVLVWRGRYLKRRLSSFFSLRAVTPFFLVMVPAIAAMGYYNYRLTGSPAVFPYTLNQKAYAASPHLYVLPPTATPEYRHEHFRRFWVEWDGAIYNEARSHPIQTMAHTLKVLATFYLVNSLGIAAILGLVFAGGTESICAAAILALPMLGLLLAKGILPHYLAPAFGALLILSALGLQTSERWRVRGRNIGPTMLLVLLGVSFGSSFSGIARTVNLNRQAVRGIEIRPRIIEQLRSKGGRHLVIVRYSPAHDVHEEWVYNRADIDHADIVWAQDMGEQGNRELVEYYRERRVWILRPDGEAPELVEYRSDKVPERGLGQRARAPTPL